MRVDLRITLFVFISFNAAYSQTTSGVVSINRVRSLNGNFFLRSIPFDNIYESSTGQTIVYSKDSVEQYQLPRYFEIENNRSELFLSNDGQTVVHILNFEFVWKGQRNPSVSVYTKGMLTNRYFLNDLIKCDNKVENCQLFYNDAIDSVTRVQGKRKVVFKAEATDFEKYLCSNSVFTSGDSVLIFSKTSIVNLIDLNTGLRSTKPLRNYDNGNVSSYSKGLYMKKNFEASYRGLFLSDDKPLEDGLAKHLDMKVFPDDIKNPNQFKAYTVYVESIVDKKGIAVIDSLGNNDGLSVDKIQEFFRINTFSTKYIPKQVEKWRVREYFSLMDKSKKKSRAERKKEIVIEREEYNKRLLLDTINGIYIPKNIEECFTQLNKILSPKLVAEIKNLKSRDETIRYHHGLGMWLRNNWGLWGGSRLQQYLFSKGFEHPDDMTGDILAFYYDWLNGTHEGWRELESK